MDTVEEINMAIPDCELIEYEGALYGKLQPPDTDWLNLGLCLAPQTVWQTIVYHFCHGLLMRYPLLDVIRFSLTERNSFV